MTKLALLASLNSPEIPHDANVTLVLTPSDERLTFTAINDARVWRSDPAGANPDAVLIV